MENGDSDEIQGLNLLGVIGFNGAVSQGVHVHPGKEHLVYPLGCNVVVEHLSTHRKTFLHGHTDDIVCLAVSRTGRYVASGQCTDMGYKASIIVWDYQSLGEGDSESYEYARFSLHKVKVQALAFSPSEDYLVSLGGQDDGSVIVWSLEKREPICGSPAQRVSAGITKCLSYLNSSNDTFITAGEGTLRIWKLDVENRKIIPKDVTLGQVKRSIMSIEVEKGDSSFLCGTSTGDVLCVSTSSGLLQYLGPENQKHLYSLGVTALSRLTKGVYLVGTGDGTVELLQSVERGEGRKKRQTFARTDTRFQGVGAVTSIALQDKGHGFYVATDKGHVYKILLPSFKASLILTSHSSAINDIVFAKNCSELFATCSYEDIRVFHTPTQNELLRINVPNMTCNCLDLYQDGKGIVSGWSDSTIRVFYPETGRLMFAISNAHKKEVTAIAVTSDSDRIISGDKNGDVRVWQTTDVTPERASSLQHLSYRSYAQIKEAKQKIQERSFISKLIASMKEQHNEVTCIRVSKDDAQCITASKDGTCIVWCLNTFSRKLAIFAKTLFYCVCYRPDESQFLTSGTDRKIGYWDMYDGQLLRELDGSKSGAVLGMDMSPDGESFVTGGEDKLVKLWKCDEGSCTHYGKGHSKPITRVRISPDGRIVATASVDGSVHLWECPRIC